MKHIGKRVKTLHGEGTISKIEFEGTHMENVVVKMDTFTDRNAELFCNRFFDNILCYLRRDLIFL